MVARRFSFANLLPYYTKIRVYNKKILLRERKRHTARRLACARFADWRGGGWYPIQSWTGGGGLSHPVLDWGGGGVTPSSLGWGVPQGTPHSRSAQGWGVPRSADGGTQSSLGWGYPPRSGWGVPHPVLDGGTPHPDLGWGTPCQQNGVLPSVKNCD